MNAPRLLALAACWSFGCATVPAPVPTPPVGSEPAPTAQPAPAFTWTPSAVPEPLAPIERTRPAAVSRTLKNGLKVVVVEDHRARLVKLRLFFATGSARENELNAGVTAFALQALGDRFDVHDEGGELVDLSEKSARWLALAKGASLRFDVTPDVSSVGLDGYSRDSNSLLQLLHSVVNTPRQGRESFQGRRQAAVDFINELELSDGPALEQFLLQMAFGPTHPYARSVYGTATSLERVGLEDVVNRQAELLTPVGTTLLIVGDVKAAPTISLVERTFGSWRGEAPVRVQLEPPRANKRKGVVFLPRKPARNTLVCLTRPLVELKGLSRPATQLAVAVAGTARIGDQLREKFGLTYSVNAQLIERRHASAMAVCSRVRSDDAIIATRLMLESMSALATSPPTPEELERARAQAVTQLELSQDDLDGVVAKWRDAVAFGRAAPPEDEVAAVKAVTLEQVRAAARALGQRDRLQVILSGERPMAEAVARAHSLGGLQTPRLRKVDEESLAASPEAGE